MHFRSILSLFCYTLGWFWVHFEPIFLDLVHILGQFSYILGRIKDRNPNLDNSKILKKKTILKKFLQQIMGHII